MRARLSAFLRMVEAGEGIVVTDRGREIAEIRRPGHAPGSSGLEKLVASGWIRPALEPEDFSWLDEPRPCLPGGTARELVDFERGGDDGDALRRI